MLEIKLLNLIIYFAKMAFRLTVSFILMFFAYITIFDFLLTFGFFYVFMRSIIFDNNIAGLIFASCLCLVLFIIYRTRWGYKLSRIFFSGLWGYVFAYCGTKWFTLSQPWFWVILVAVSVNAYLAHYRIYIEGIDYETPPSTPPEPSRAEISERVARMQREIDELQGRNKV